VTDEERERLRYFRESIARIADYTGGGREAFDREPMVQDADAVALGRGATGRAAT
jgi:hypothetical protein